MISHGILLILPPNCTKFVFFGRHQEINIDVESPHFNTFSIKRHECEIGKKKGHGKSRNYHRQITCMEKYFVKSVGTLMTLPTDHQSKLLGFVMLFAQVHMI